MNFYVGCLVCQELQVTTIRIATQSFISTHVINSLSGQHCCLWCLVKSDDLKKPPSARQPAALRTTESISSDYERFEKAGKNIKRTRTSNGQNTLTMPLKEHFYMNTTDTGEFT